MSKDSKRWRWLRRGALALGLALAAGVAALPLIYPPEYVRRLLVLGDADVDDQHWFPRREIPAGTPADPPAAPEPERVRRAFAAAQDGAVLEPWLAANGTLAFVVLQHGRIVHEAYFDGHERTTPVTSFSVAKSLLSALLTAAQADALIASLDEPVGTWLPELPARDARFAQVTLRHLLDMHSGIAYREVPFFNGDNAKTYYWPDLRALALEHTRIAAAPRGEWQYNNYHPLLLGLVLERATRQPVATYLGRRLWQPAGLGPGASWSLDSAASGFEKLESGINARALDFARFGQLYLDGGVAADGTRVLPESLVREATSPSGAVSLSTLRPGLAYRQFWWIQQRAGGPADFSARGNHGQFVFVSPRNGVVIARFGRRYGPPAGVWMQLFERMADELGRH